MCNVLAERVLEIPFLGNWNQPKNGQVEQGFSLFFAKFLAYMMIFQSSAAPSVRYI